MASSACARVRAGRVSSEARAMKATRGVGRRVVHVFRRCRSARRWSRRLISRAVSALELAPESIPRRRRPRAARERGVGEHRSTRTAAVRKWTGSSEDSSMAMTRGRFVPALTRREISSARARPSRVTPSALSVTLGSKCCRVHVLFGVQERLLRWRSLANTQTSRGRCSLTPRRVSTFCAKEQDGGQ